MTNALKYGLPDTAVDVSLAGDDRHVVFEVSNRGLPIPNHFMRQMFEPMTRQRSERAADDGSLGLGLYITREIVAAHGGEIAARSDDSETVFKVSLPRLA